MSFHHFHDDYILRGVSGIGGHKNVSYTMKNNLEHFFYENPRCAFFCGEKIFYRGEKKFCGGEKFIFRCESCAHFKKLLSMRSMYGVTTRFTILYACSRMIRNGLFLVQKSAPWRLPCVTCIAEWGILRNSNAKKWGILIIPATCSNDCYLSA